MENQKSSCTPARPAPVRKKSFGFQKHFKNSIRAKMLLWFGIPLLILFSLLAAVNYMRVKNTVIPLTKELSREVLAARSAEIGRLMDGYTSNIRTLAALDVLREGAWEDIRGHLIDEERTLNGDYEMIFYADLNGHFITSTDSEGNVSDRDYFKAVINEGKKEYISNPIVSRASGEYVFVTACRVVDRDGALKGLAAATVTIDTLSEIAGDIKIGENGFGYIVNHNGLLVAHPDEKLRMKLNLLFSEDMGFEGLDKIGWLMVQGESGALEYKTPNGSNMITVFSPVPHTLGWSLGISMFEEELMGKAHSLMRGIIFLMICVLGAVGLIVVFISGRIAKPIAELERGVKKVSSGDLDQSLNIRTGDEIENLAQSFNKMTINLKEHIKNLQTETAKRQAVESELTIAKEIQQSILPRTFPPFPGRDEFELYSIMHPAKEVGGDFYDFFFYDKNTFIMTVGDVSGKGVSAALFMMLSRTLLHTVASEIKDPALVLKKVNNILAQDNETSMFVTVFLACYYIDSGKIVYSNAGHIPALKINTAEEPLEFTSENSTALGVFPEVDYQSGELKLDPGEKFIIYTDGIPEAFNEETGEFYETERFINYFLKNSTLQAKQYCAGIAADVMKFQKGDQHDDLTLSVFKRLK